MTLVAGPPQTGPRPFADFVALDAETIRERTWAAKRSLGRRAVILGHHYQRESIIEFADFRGDSFKLSQLAAAQSAASYIIFCGVHFMAESADVLAQPHQTVILPDLKAGCSMADMASLDDVEDAWDQLLSEHGDTFTPITYMNSSAALKAFCGARGGVVCTSSNARAALEWAWARKPRVLFFPDQHLGRNTAFRMGVPLDQMAEWIWRAPNPRQVNARAFAPTTKLVLWRGFCSVHTKFDLRQIESSAPRTRAYASWCTPSARSTWSGTPTSSARPSSSSIRCARRSPARAGRSARRSTSSIASRSSIPSSASARCRRTSARARP
jgi:quinolinate synthase